LEGLALAEKTGQRFREAFPRLTESRCDCCGETFVDEVGLLLVEEAVVSYRDARVEREAKKRRAWAEAERRTQDALREAQAAR
jgi:hypothetical protein